MSAAREHLRLEGAAAGRRQRVRVPDGRPDLARAGASGSRGRARPPTTARRSRSSASRRRSTSGRPSSRSPRSATGTARACRSRRSSRSRTPAARSCCSTPTRRSAAIPIDVAELGVDFLGAGVLKYLLASAGLGFLWCRPGLAGSLLPTQTGWFADKNIFEMDIHDYSPSPTARRFESGTPPIPAIYAGIAGIELIREIGIAATREHVTALNERLIAGVDELGGVVATPRAPERRGALVCIRSTDSAGARPRARRGGDRHLRARRQPPRLLARLQRAGRHRHAAGRARAAPRAPRASLIDLR